LFVTITDCCITYKGLIKNEQGKGDHKPKLMPLFNWFRQRLTFLRSGTLANFRGYIEAQGGKKPWWNAACNLSNFYGLHDRPQSGEVDPPEPPPTAGQVNRRHRRGIRLLHRPCQALASHLQKLGLEWLPRLLQEPQRLWRRMGISAPIFLWNVLKAKISGK
jgi:hypothetical protein